MFQRNLLQKYRGHNSEIVCVELLKRYCLQIVLYATEAVYPDKTSLKRLDKLVDRSRAILENVLVYVT